MDYEIKWGPEIAWAAATAAAVVGLEALLTFDATEVLSDPKTWALGILTACMRTVAASVLNALRRRSSA